MDIDALLDAFQDFDKKGKKETCPVLEQFLCHVAKTGQPLLGSPISSRISWSQFKSYFMFKLEKVMDDFHTSMPEQRGPNNPNVEYIPFEEMKTRILKIVDGYNGIPFTIQRLCELLMDPKRNYTGTDKFLRGLEKNVMVVSCVYPTSEKNAASSLNRMNGVMFRGNSSLYLDSRNINGPSTPKPLHRPKLSMSSSLSTNGLPDYLVSKEPEPTTEENEEHHISDSSLSEGELSPNSGVKNKHPEEDDSSDSEEHEVKRLKFDEQEEDETEKEEEEKESEASCKMSGSLSEMPDSLQDSCGQECQSGTSCDTTCDDEPSSRTETSEREEESSATEDVHSPKNDDTVDQPDLPAPSEKSTSFEQDNVEESSSGNSDGEDLSSNKQLPSSGSSSPDLSTEGDADNSNITETAKEPGEHD
ncbi:serine serine/threonine-protein phosphatase 4 regulatory subunit 2-like [Solea senegalensis]|uniref:Serine serine/threonine-protein phosphatase 4 regulatory subunit 2-like n=2 Tax=Solea senegalensis TaxID=28829 RepID=A0AAV6SVT5_SOLSE|nr:serine/threonine-protein phosphatase 4 regulatory subunit 2-like isoform X1 [Solea senegalensis]KAG7520954.1 serine serine/threonine-protein phosphatase 4 regulatory subunit 2-like [Solea senegalensis]